MYKIDKHECIECGLCANICPKKVIDLNPCFGYRINNGCVSCGLCAKKCPVDAIEKITEE
ncbi:MAG: 4Fe-4S binding protein [Psychrilyobacter sp.]|nr:4Fe-4S binding protein [Psychrilyobacter sp.]